MIIIGITGGIGCGKSEVCRELKNKYGAFTISADEIGHDLLKAGSDCFEELKELLGEDMIGPDGSFDRRKVGDRAFADPSLLDQMNEIIHPAVLDRIFDLLDVAESKKRRLAVIEAALLLEAGYKQYCNDVWYIYASEKTRIRRLKESRNLSDEKIADIMSRQLPEEVFREQCDYTIDNNLDFDITAMQIRERLITLGIR